MTAFYVFRAVFLTFFGTYRGDHHPHESPAVMTVPLMALAALSLAGGFIDIPKWLEPLFPAAEGHHDTTLVAVSVIAGLAGIALAYFMVYLAPRIRAATRSTLHAGLQQILRRRNLRCNVVRPVVAGSRELLWKTIDVSAIDGMVNGVANLARSIGGGLKLLQSGNIRSYATWVVCGSIVLIVAIGFMAVSR
jgi:NADH-quinone oxidoreductase subunit L